MPEKRLDPDRDVRVERLVSIVLGSVVLLVVAGLLSEGLLRLLAPAHPGPPEAPTEAPRELAAERPMAPRLQRSPSAEARELRHRQLARLEEWAWFGEARSVARVPIERAMELLVEEEEEGSP